MAIDFSKIKLGPRRDYLYKCSKCRREDWYSLKLRPWMLECKLPYHPCGGRLVLIDVKERSKS